MVEQARAADGEKKVAIVVIHGVGETSTGWINEYIVDPIGLARRDVDLVAHSELHSLAQDERKADVRFLTLVRRAAIGPEKVSFVEMLWADLARISSGPVTYILATLKLLFEAPDVLARAFLRNRWRGPHRLIAFLVLTSSRLLTWLILGLNLTVIACAAFMTAVWLMRSAKFLPSALRYDDSTVAFWLSPVILGLLVLGAWLFVRMRDRDIGWSELGRGLALSAALMLAYVVVVTFSANAGLQYKGPLPAVARDFLDHWSRMSDFDRGRTAVFLVWVVWCVSTLLAMGLLLLVGAARLMGWRPANPVPLAASWAAIFNILIQAVVLKLIITPASILACTQLKSAYEAAGKAEGLDPKAVAATVATMCDVKVPSGIFFFSLLETVFIVAGLIWIVMRRRAVAASGSAEGMPRLIVHPLLVGIAAFTVTLHIGVFAEQMLNVTRGTGPYVSLFGGLRQDIGYGRLSDELLAFLVWLVPVYIFALWFFHSASAPLVHIARELVDHQYRISSRRLRALGKEAGANDTWAHYPRRAPIVARLDAIMDRLLARDDIGKLILFTHSQGSVIAFDYLRSNAPSPAFERIGEIHVVTMGSPLSHIYAYYFDEYARPVRRSDLRGNVVSWTNFWRVDDPIGTRVDIVSDGFIENRMLGRGGHVDYWREKEVQAFLCEKLGLIRSQ